MSDNGRASLSTPGGGYAAEPPATHWSYQGQSPYAGLNQQQFNQQWNDSNSLANPGNRAALLSAVSAPFAVAGLATALGGSGAAAAASESGGSEVANLAKVIKGPWGSTPAASSEGAAAEDAAGGGSGGSKFGNLFKGGSKAGTALRVGTGLLNAANSIASNSLANVQNAEQSSMNLNSAQFRR